MSSASNHNLFTASRLSCIVTSIEELLSRFALRTRSAAASISLAVDPREVVRWSVGAERPEADPISSIKLCIYKRFCCTAYDLLQYLENFPAGGGTVFPSYMMTRINNVSYVQRDR